MRRTIIVIVSFLMIIGAIGVSLNLILGNQTVVFLTKIRMENGMFIYRFNFKEYIMNITTSVGDTSKLALSMPTRTWEILSASNFGTALGNNLALILDYILFGINVLIYPMRIGAYLLKTLLSIVGINMNPNNIYNGLGWLIDLVDFLIERIAIPYV